MKAFVKTACIGWCLLLVACSPIATKPNTEAGSLNAQLGLAYLQQGQVEQAKSSLLHALQEAPNDPLVLQAMGYFLDRTGETKAAEHYYVRAIELAPKNGAVQNNYGIYLCRQGQYQNAITHFLLATQDINYLHVASAYKNAGLCALKIPDKKLAREYLRKSVISDPSRISPRRELTKLS